MTLIVHATNVHQGGGRTLLLALLSAIRQRAVVLLDERLAPLPVLHQEVRVIRIAPTMPARLQAERNLPGLCGSGDTLLCFGNLPPLLPSRARVFVYLQNRYLSSPMSTAGLPWRSKARLGLERLWLRFLLRDAQLVVQTESMAREVRQHLRRECHVLPFFPDRLPQQADGPQPSVPRNPAGSSRYDYVYVASGEPHKNHRRLVQAWRILATRGCFPSLRLTLHEERDAGSWASTMREAKEHGLRIHSEAAEPGQISNLYAGSRALIYPSLAESFGLPLLEARAAGLDILASERDFVRDVVLPVQTFDPESPLSIARAVLRHMSLPMDPMAPSDAAGFLNKLENLTG